MQSSLPTIYISGLEHRLPNHNELLDKEAITKRDFLPAKSVTKLMHDYAKALPDFVDKLAQIDVERNYHKEKTSSSYRLFNEDDVHEFYYQKSLEDDLYKYTIAASNKLTGAWERFTVNKASDRYLESAHWHINGNLFENLELQKQKDSSFQTRFIDPGVQGMGTISTKYLFNENKNGTLRAHNVFVTQAKRLIELHQLYGINGKGAQIGNWLFMSRQTKNQRYQREYILTKIPEAKYDEDSKSVFLVRTNNYGNIQEIMQVSSRADQSFKLIRGDNCAEINEEAELRVIDKKEQERVVADIKLIFGDPDKTSKNGQRDYGLQELFSASEEGRELLEAAQARLDKEFLNTVKVYKIKVEKPGFDIKKSGENLLTQENISRLHEDLGILINKPHHKKYALDPDLVKYANLRNEQVSLVFYDSDYGPGFNRAKVLDENGNEVLFKSYGPARLRESTSRNNKVINETKIPEFLKTLGLKLTSEEQDKAIIRWHLMREENKSALAKLGFLIDGETIYQIAPAGKEAIRKTRIKSLVDNKTQRSLFNYPANMFIGKFKKATPGVYEPQKNILSIARDFVKFLSYLGFRIADAGESELYIKKMLELNEESKERMQNIIKQRIDTMGLHYMNSLAFSLAFLELRELGFEKLNIVENENAKPMFISAFKGEQEYLIRVSSQKSNFTKQIAPLKDAVLDHQSPLVLKIRGIDKEQRTAKQYELIEII